MQIEVIYRERLNFMKNFQSLFNLFFLLQELSFKKSFFFFKKLNTHELKNKNEYELEIMSCRINNL
jgi:hypothetical protein